MPVEWFEGGRSITPRRVDVEWLGRVDLSSYLEHDADSLAKATAAVRAGVVASPTLSIGAAQAAQSACVRRAADVGIPTVRRTTGGTGVLHLADDLVWSAILPRTPPVVGRDFARAYSRYGAGAVRTLERLGHSAKWGAAPGLSPDFCLFGSRGHVLEVGERIVGGAAQHLSPGALLHHGVLNYRVDRPRLRSIFQADSEAWDHRLGGLTELGEVPGPESVGRLLTEALEAEIRGLFV